MQLAQNPRSSQFQQSYPFSQQQLEVDTTSLDDHSSISSPRSTHSLLSRYGARFGNIPLVAFDSLPSTAIPRQTGESDLVNLQSTELPTAFDDLSSGQSHPLDLMQSDSWFLGGHVTPKSVGRLSHNRESSLSSLGSAGPASPFSHNTSNPQIAVTDQTSDGFGDMHSQDNSYYQLAKTMGPAHDGLYSGYGHFGAENTVHGMGYPAVAIHRPRTERAGLLPAPELSIPFGRNGSHPASVASSIAGDSPATPSLGEPDDDRRRKVAIHSVPKLDRTMTDVYGDELYSPSFTITSALPPHIQMPMSPSHDVFAQRLHAANSQHLSAVHTTVSTGSRSKSPFRQGSPLAPSPAHDFGASAASSRLRFNSAEQLREQRKAEQDAHALRQQMAMKADPDTPKTISPKDAILEFHEPEGEANFPLFPSQDSSAFIYDQLPKHGPTQMNQGPYERSSPSTSGASNSPFHYASSQLHSGIPVPQQYPFIANARQSHDTASSRLGSAESSSVDSQASMQRIGGSTVEGGTYTCTYHGCSQRFETPALLQKHKREGHRQAQGLTGTRRPDTIQANMMSQAGPHRCDRINPSTGKPCNTVFSRPYDLTRHEDTIHNARKQKVRCNLCTEEKTFSRADALTRHYRVCHPDVEFPGKHRRRGGHSS
jgi:hypothetical protein